MEQFGDIEHANNNNRMKLKRNFNLIHNMTNVSTSESIIYIYENNIE